MRITTVFIHIRFFFSKLNQSNIKTEPQNFTVTNR